MSVKEYNFYIVYLFVEKGFRVVLLEVLYYGEWGEEMVVEELVGYFWDIVFNEIEEIGVFKMYFEKEGLIDSGCIGFVGILMGGIIMFGVLIVYDWIKVGVSLMGSLNYVELF